MIKDLPLPITGQSLRDTTFSTNSNRQIYADGLFYEKSSIMISADPGTGKSLLLLQACVQLASGLPLYGGLTVPKPIKVYYIQKERPQLEVIERLKTFSENIDIKWDNLVVDSSMQYLNLSNIKYCTDIRDRIARFEPQLVAIDPIGAGLGGLSKDEVANNFCSMLNYIQSTIGNAFYLSHHTSRVQFSSEGKPIEKSKPFYGSQWLDAFVTGHYHVTRTDEGTKWRKTKDNYGLLYSNINMEYDPDNNLSFIVMDKLTVKDKVINYISSVKDHKREFKFSDLALATGCVMTSLRHTLRDPIFNELLERHKSIGEATLYKIK